MGWGDSFSQAWNTASDAGKAAARSVAQSARSAYDYCADKANAAYEGAKQAGEAAVDKAKLVAIEARYLQGLGPKEAAKRAYDKVNEALGRETAGSPVQQCPLASAACNKLKEARDKAILANDTYRENGEGGSRLGETAYQRLDPVKDAQEIRDNLGIEDPKEMLEPSGSSFKARIYKRALPSGKSEYVIGYRGTQTGEDWRQNVIQGSGIGESAHYERAKRLANLASAKSETTGNSLSFTGHSLGGGMASAASATTGHPAMTYNAAGLNAHTIGGAYPNPPAPVEAYYTPTDPLSAAQDNRKIVLKGAGQGVGYVPYAGPPLKAALGAWVMKEDLAGTPVMPKAYGERRILPYPPGREPPDLSIDGFKEAHGMGLVVEGIDVQRAEQGCP